MDYLEKYSEAVNEFVENMLHKYKDRIDIIILFGSVARGDAGDESDIDIMVIGDLSLEELIDISFPLLLKHGKLISPKDMKKSRFDELSKEGYSFINNILDEGVVLYERVGETS